MEKRTVVVGVATVLGGCLIGASLMFGLGIPKTHAAVSETKSLATTKTAEEPTPTRTVSIRAGEEVRATTAESEAPASKARRTAIFVWNHASAAQFNEKLPALEDQVSSQLSGKEFTIMSREEIMKAVKVYPIEPSRLGVRSVRSSVEVASATALGGGSLANATAARSSQEVIVAMPEDQNEAANRNSLGTVADRLLSDQTSALRLAQAMGAQFMLFVNVGTFGKETVSINRSDIGVSTKNTTYNLRGTYKLVEAYTGGGISGATFKCSRAIRQTESVQVETDDLVNQLIEDAAAKVATGVLAKAAEYEIPKSPDKVAVLINAYAKDLVGNEVQLPQVRLSEGGVAGKPDMFPALVSATIEIDGFAMGTTPATIKLFPGSHKLRLLRPGFQPVDQYFLASEGLELSPSMWMNDAGFQRWKEIRDFLNKLDTRRQMTDAQVKVLEGYAQYLRQSGFMVNIKQTSDIKVDTKEAPKITEVHGLPWNYWNGAY